MVYKSPLSSLFSTMIGTPSDFPQTSNYYQNSLQQKINEEWKYASDVYEIQEELTSGNGVYTDVQVRITHVINSATGVKLGDDFRGLIFKDMSHNYGLGYRYQFDNNTWITINSDVYHYPTASATIRRCNNTINYLDVNGNIVTEPCIIEYKMLRDNFDFKSEIIVPMGTIMIVAQNNNKTNDIKINDRFIFNKQCFKVNAVNNFLLKNTLDSNSAPLLYLTLFKDNINTATDNVQLSVADYYKINYILKINQADFSQIVGYSSQLTSTVKLNDNIINIPVIWESDNPSIGTIDVNGNIQLISDGVVNFKCSMQDNLNINNSISVTVNTISVDKYEVRILPNTTELLQGKTQQYSVYLFKNNIQQSDVFYCSTSGINVSNVINYYTFNQDDGNHFTISNRKLYTVNPLTINCVSGSYSGSINIKLKGAY